MNIKEIFTAEGSTFGQTISNWAEGLNSAIQHIDIKSNEHFEDVDGLVIFHENHDITKSNQEVLAIFEAKQRAISKIDINGTLMVAVSNFSLWMERNKCKSLLIIGSDELLKNPNLERFLDKLKTA